MPVSTTKDIASAINAASKQKTKAYDTTATVMRIEGNTAWVHIPSGVSETPVALTIDAKAGDTVQVRVSGGRAWLTGNATAPPTDDTTAQAAKTAIDKQKEHFWYDSSGAHVKGATGYRTDLKSTGMYVVESSSGTVVAQFGQTAVVGVESAGGSSHSNIYIDDDSVDIRQGDVARMSISANKIQMNEEDGTLASAITYSNSSDNPRRMWLGTQLDTQNYASEAFNIYDSGGGQAMMTVQSGEYGTLLEAGSVGVTHQRVGGTVYGGIHATTIGSFMLDQNAFSVTDSNSTLASVDLSTGKFTANAITETLFDVSTETATITSIAAGSVAAKAVTVTKTGYYPLGVVGFQVTQAVQVFRRCYLSDIASGSCKVNFNVRNTGGSAADADLTAYVLWVKTS